MRHLVAIALGLAILAALQTADAKPALPNKRAPGSAFVAKATWTESMLATREALVAAKATTGDAVEATWKDVTAAFPRRAAGFVKDCHRNHLAWFRNSKNVSHETWLLGRILEELGDAGAPLAKQLAALEQANVPASDAHWLNLYLRGCRYRDCRPSLNTLWIADIRRALEGQVTELLRDDVSPEDPRWNEFSARTDRISKALGAGRPLEVATLGKSLTKLNTVLPDRFQSDAGLTAALDRCQQHWQAALPAIVKGDLQGLPTLLQETQAVRRAIVMAVSGMREYLAVPAHASLADEWEREYAALQHDLDRRWHFAKVAPETFRHAALVLEADRDPADMVLRRSGVLLADLKRTTATDKLAAAEQSLVRLQTTCAALDPVESEARFVLFVEACRVRRQIAFANPLLNFDKLVFLKRHRAIYNHMCDQYYGIAAAAGGGLYVLSDVFGPRPQVRDILEHSIVERGRLQGQRLSGGPVTPAAARYDGLGRRTAEDQGGAFLSPDLSYDAGQLAFAYVECQGDPEHRTHTDPTRGHWHEGRCYHVFKVNLDGSHLEQLTDGTWNDFDPCFMPGGRIAFTSERRGGYLRCGRVCPTFTIYDMAADGRDVRCLSFHETNEWHPSVGHDGMLLYTRWDYVDRHSMVAHHPWSITPDGRDPRALQGNYTARQSRPDMELDIRAIPRSHKLIATAAPHHGQSFGSLVLLDPRVQDDDQMAAVKRITPEIGFPESQRGTETYGEAWPLSEDYYLCVYDAAMEVPGLGPKGDYGIYLVDSFGTRELLYRDPLIGAHNPLPLRPRPTPPVLAQQAQRVAAERPADATVGVVNVYHSVKPWPDKTRITALRVYQVLPLSVASVATAHNTGLQIPATSSINIARAVLGSVPVEADGSAYFRAPACRELFFQALDEEGLAITTMRSATQFQPGEQLTCQGCHEPRHGAPPGPKTHPLAMRRAPSPIMPDVDGSNPFSYPRLVQPVLDKHCVACHREKASEKVPPLDSSLVSVASRGFMDRPTTYFISYMSLTPKFGFFSYDNHLETTPGQVGARVAPLYQLLRKGHYDVKLSPEEMHRIALWLDSCSPFYGVYEKEGGAAQLRGEIVRPTLE